MERETYDRIWEKIVEPVYENISDGDPYMTLDLNRKERIYKKYIKIRDKIKKKYMEDPLGNIDRHKIASIMMAAIVDIYPVRISCRYIFGLWKDKKEIDQRYIYVNETLALFTALSIIESYKDYGIDGKVERERKSIVLPETFNESDYVTNTCIDLYFSKRSNKMNVLTFSNVFFLLERMAELNERSVIQ